jgi:predicted nucleic-acid-binding protein
MRAVDANVLVRLVTQDDPEQAKIAQSLLHEPILILPTVLIETVWVLQSSYRMSRADISHHLSQILGYPLTQLIEGAAVRWAMDRFAAGADFADMLHLALASEAGGTCFSTLDSGVRKAAADRLESVETLGVGESESGR